MKTIRMTRDFDYWPVRQVVMAYRAGVTYERVPEAAVAKILAAEAGEIVLGDVAEWFSEAQQRSMECKRSTNRK